MIFGKESMSFADLDKYEHKNIKPPKKTKPFQSILRDYTKSEIENQIKNNIRFVIEKAAFFTIFTIYVIATPQVVVIANLNKREIDFYKKFITVLFFIVAPLFLIRISYIIGQNCRMRKYLNDSFAQEGENSEEMH